MHKFILLFILLTTHAAEIVLPLEIQEKILDCAIEDMLKIDTKKEKIRYTTVSFLARNYVKRTIDNPAALLKLLNDTSLQRCEIDCYSNCVERSIIFHYAMQLSKRLDLLKQQLENADCREIFFALGVFKVDNVTTQVVFEVLGDMHKFDAVALLLENRKALLPEYYKELIESQLWYASRRHNYLLFKKIIELHEQEFITEYPLFGMACLGGFTDMVRDLLPHQEYKNRHEEKDPFMLACAPDNGVCLLLLESGYIQPWTSVCRPREDYFSTQEGLSPLHRACEGQCLEAVKYMVKTGLVTQRPAAPDATGVIHGGYINEISSIEGMTPLRTALKTFHAPNIELLEYLIEQGADCNIADKKHILPLNNFIITPLAQAIFIGNLPAVRVLVERGKANVNHFGINDKSESLLDYANTFCAKHPQNIQYREIRDYLIAHGAKTMQEIEVDILGAAAAMYKED